MAERQRPGKRVVDADAELADAARSAPRAAADEDIAEVDRSVRELDPGELAQAARAVAEPETSPPLSKLTRAQLIAAMAESRLELSEDIDDLRQSLSVSQRVESSYQRHLVGWLGASALVGFIIARPLLVKKKQGKGPNAEEKIVPAKGFVAGTIAFVGTQVAKVAVPAIRMAVSSYIGSKVAAKDESDE